MTGLPKKYAKMGFKKGWRLFKASKGKAKKSYSAGETMAKSRKTRRYTAKKSHKSHRKSGLLGGFGGGMGKMVGAGLYGAVRESMSNALAPLTEKLPLGNLSDEAVMIGTLWAGKKFLGRKVPMVNDFANAGILIESARIGATLAAGQFQMGSASVGTSSGLNIIG
jgi:hypothetical protein